MKRMRVSRSATALFVVMIALAKFAGDTGLPSERPAGRKNAQVLRHFFPPFGAIKDDFGDGLKIIG
ncbi:hypothetical protein [Parvibaculum sp.]|uniref:hypothetical protein n=1 Tax=Parvibaculum sp. TaxID=2024848 RepID=UPI00391A658E